MKKIIVDLDVVTVGTWDSGKNGDLARSLMARIAKKEFYVVTPFLLLERISKWKHVSLTEHMKEFYIKNSDLLLTDDDIRRKIGEVSAKVNGFNEARLLKDLRSAGIGNQDAFLVSVAAIFGLNLVTFNRKTLRSKADVINEVMKKHGIESPTIVAPEQI